jgi:hypothetical protein
MIGILQTCAGDSLLFPCLTTGVHPSAPHQFFLQITGKEQAARMARALQDGSTGLPRPAASRISLSPFSNLI